MTKAIIDKFLIHMQNRDLKNLVDLFADQVKWEIPGNTQHIPWLGTRKYKVEVEEFFKLLWKETAPISAEIHEILIDEGRSIIKGSFTTKMLATGNILTSIFFIHILIVEGKIVEYTFLEDSYAVSQSLLK